MKINKKITMIIASIIIVCLISGGIVYINLTGINSEEIINNYVDLINKKDYEAMYQLISSESQKSITKEDFIARNKNIYEGIGAKDISVSITGKSKEDKNIINYDMTMQTDAGEVKFSNSVKTLKEDKEYKLVWDSKLIFPQLTNDSKVRIESSKSTRGSILDRNGEALAYDGVASEVGIVPGKLGENREESIKKIAEILDTTVDVINNELNASYVKDDMFIPIKTIAANDEREEKLLSVPGIMINNKDVRVYPLGEEAAHLIGYVQNINAEELEKNKDKEYTTTSLIGKVGLELIYEDRLRGIDGEEIYIVDENGTKVDTIAKKEVKNGENIKLTIDKSTQSAVFNEIKGDKGTSVAMNHQTGEILALASAPAYDPNDFVLGMSDSKWKSLNGDINKPLYNRFESTFSPGSVFKPITAAIGLESKAINADDNKDISGLKWQKDESWGDYYVTRVTDYSSSTNLLKAMVYSDNIYFAQAALDIGKDNFASKLKDFGFEEELPLDYKMNKSKYSSEGEIKTDIQLADTGYGQGQLQVNPVHLASMYTLFVNDGSIIQPYIEYKDNSQKTIWKENVVSKENADIVLNAMIQVVEDANGTASEAKIPGVSIAGKTGTAEIKLTQDDKDGTELGWFVGLNADKSGKNLLVVTMIEDVKDKGGSHYVTPKVKNILQR